MKQGAVVLAAVKAMAEPYAKRCVACLEAHGATLNDIVKMTMYFTDRKTQWPAFDKIRREIWKTDPPATTGVGIDQLEQDAQVEIEAIAVIPDA